MKLKENEPDEPMGERFAVDFLVRKWFIYVLALILLSGYAQSGLQ